MTKQILSQLLRHRLLWLTLLLLGVWLPAAAQEGVPRLAVATDVIAHTGSVVAVPLHFTGNGHAVSALLFALALDSAQLQLTTAAEVEFLLPQSWGAGAFESAGPPRLNLSIYSLAGAAIPDGRLVTIPLRASCPAGADPASSITVPLRFAQSPAASFASSQGADLPGVTVDGAITIRCTPLPPNRPPIAQDDTTTVDEDRQRTIRVLSNDRDPDGDAIHLVQANQAAHGSTQIDGDRVTYTPHANYHGEDFFAYTIADAKGATATALVSITVNPVNDPPLAVDDVAVAFEDTPLRLDVTANDSDVDGDPLVVTIRNGPKLGTAVANGDGTVTYTPALNRHGTDRFTYRIDDGHGGRDDATVDITIRPVNDAPQAVDDSAQLLEDQTASIAVLANDSDVDGDVLHIIGVSKPSHGTATVVNNAILYRPAADFSGADSLHYTIHDGHGGQSTATVALTVSPVNDPPYAQDAAAATAEDTPVSITVQVTDPDDSALSVEIVDPPRHGAVAGAGLHTFVYTPAANFHGADSFGYRARDPAGATGTARVTLTVTPANDAPAAGDDAAITTAGAPILIDVLANDVDVDGDPLAVTALGQPAQGSAAATDAGTIQYMPPNSTFAGVDSFTYTVSDGEASDQATVTVVVQGAGASSVMARDDRVRTDEDTSILVDVLANDKAKEGTLHLLAVTQAANGVTAVENGRVRYTPQADFYGEDSFRYIVGDGGQGAAQARVIVTIRGVNDAPLAADDRAETVEGQWSDPIYVLLNDADPEGDALSIAAYDPVARHGIVRWGQDSSKRETLRYRPDPGFSGIDRFSYQVADKRGATATATVHITVLDIDEPPNAVDDLVSTDEDVPLSIDPLANDSDPEGGAITLQTWSTPALGTLARAENILIYTPHADVNGIDSFVYTIADAAGNSAGATVTIVVNAVADPPQPVADAVLAAGDTPVTVSPLANDWIEDDTPLSMSHSQGAHGTVTSQPDGAYLYTPAPGFSGIDTFTYTVAALARSDAGREGRVTVIVGPGAGSVQAGHDTISTTEDVAVRIPVLANDTGEGALTLAGVTAAALGRVAIDGGELLYRPGFNLNGSDAITYTVIDSAGGAAQAQVTVTILAQNDPPQPAADTVITLEDEAVTFSTLANDVDVDQDPLSVTAVGLPRKGTTRLLADGRIEYTPAADENGEDAFLYRVADGAGGENEGLVRVTILPQNDAPDVGSDRAVAGEDTVLRMQPLRNDFDPDGDPLALLAVTPPNYGSAAVQVDGTLLYTPSANFNGIDTFAYIASDGVLTTTGDIRVTVQPENDAPIAVADERAIGSQEPVTLYVLDNDIDVDGDDLFITGVGPATGAITVEETALIYTPAPGLTGTEVFTYTVSDGILSAEGAVTVQYSTEAAAAVSITGALAADALVRPQQVVTYTFVAANTGSLPLTHVTVDGILPAGATVATVNMALLGRAGDVEGSGLQWRVQRLEPGQRLQVDLGLQAQPDLAAAMAMTLTLYSDQTPATVTTSPFYRFDPLAPLVEFSAVSVAGGVALTWRTGSEALSAGFDVWHSDDLLGSGAQRLTATTIAAQGGDGATYSYLDAANPGGAGYYWIEEEKIDGYRHRHQTIPVAPSGATPDLNLFYLPLVQAAPEQE